MLLTIVIGVAVFVAVFYKFLIWKFDYWTKLGVNGPKPTAFIGSYPNLLTQKRNMAYDLQEIYENYKKTDDFVGIYSCRNPQLLLINPELVHRALTNDFKHFHDNEVSQWVDDIYIFSNNPFSLTGEKWKERRAELTPGLTASRIKSVYPITNKICERLVEFVEKQIKIGSKEGIDGKELSLRFTTEVVTDCVLGIKAESFEEKPSPMMKRIRSLFDQNWVFIVFALIVGLFPSLTKIYKIRFIPKETEEFFVNLMGSVINLRKSENNKDRADFFNYIMQLQEKKKLSTEEVTAHTMTFLLDGFETTSLVLSHALLLLGRDLERQQKLRNEILENLGTTNDFEKTASLDYLDAVIHESIRIFPPATFSYKLCTEPIELKNKNGSTLLVPKGMTVVLPYHAIMVDKEYYTDAFEPERFLQENCGLKRYKDMGVYYGFSDGPRICLGMRFALTQLKAAIVEILRNFQIRVNPKTHSDNIFDPKYFSAHLDGGIWLDFKNLE